MYPEVCPEELNAEFGARRAELIECANFGVRSAEPFECRVRNAAAIADCRFS
jgi:hypothetical protein